MIVRQEVGGVCACVCLCLCVQARVCGQEVVVAGLRSVAGKNGKHAVAVTPAGHRKELCVS